MATIRENLKTRLENAGTALADVQETDTRTHIDGLWSEFREALKTLKELNELEALEQGTDLGPFEHTQRAVT